MKRILIVDDKAVNREYLKLVLETARYAVLEARDGLEALELARSERPDLVVADVLMPRMDGCEFVRRLRSEQHIAGIPVVFLTAHYIERDIEHLAKACGVHCIITKPVEPQPLLQSVRQAIQHGAASMHHEAAQRAGDQHLRLLTDTLARKAEQLEASNRRLDALVQLGQRIACERDPRRLLSVFCVAAGEMLDARCAIVVVTEDDGRTIRHITGNGVDPQEVGRLTAPRVVAELLQACLPLPKVRWFDRAAITGSSVLPAELAEMQSALLAPIGTATRAYGVVCLAGLPPETPCDAPTSRLAGSMGAVLGVAYENAVRYEQIETHASTLRSEVKERKRAQALVELANTQLEQRVEERTRELQESNMHLRQAERMASMGTLCAGLGHDMGNILMPIRARLRALEQIDLPSDAPEHIQAIGKYVEYLQSLTNGLRMLAVDSESDTNAPPATDLAQWFQDAQPLLRSPLSGQMKLIARLPKEPVAVRLSRHQIMQAIYNLVHNAADAMRGREAACIELAAEVIEGGRMVRCTVSDNGPGMPDEVRERATEPFFTTKHREFSTGLGLALVRGIVTSAGGAMSIESKPDCGTDVVLTIPAARSNDCESGDDSCGDEHLALVQVCDDRLAAIARSALSEASYTLQSAMSPDTSLWLLEAEQANTESLDQFLAADGGSCPRTVLLLGRGSEHLNVNSDSIVYFEENLRPSEFYDRLRDTLQELGSRHEQPDRHSLCG